MKCQTHHAGSMGHTHVETQTHTSWMMMQVLLDRSPKMLQSAYRKLPVICLSFLFPHSSFLVAHTHTHTNTHIAHTSHTFRLVASVSSWISHTMGCVCVMRCVYVVCVCVCECECCRLLILLS